MGKARMVRTVVSIIGTQGMGVAGHGSSGHIMGKAWRRRCGARRVGQPVLAFCRARAMRDDPRRRKGMATRRSAGGRPRDS
ncbi:hypothetical protein E2562_038948 [Oryza meyeriana var. granulata]|uniref:Uncharacterized protein n=1 Tax=Oryza meyeriana var. granulata TaxID=110450 RepID=A0A6G1DA18_9ORYZ|nr:hypothetical protein E2562_038948 [Oryza meyeriana var. granulata]